MDRWRRSARWLNLVLLFVLPGAACGLLPLLSAARLQSSPQGVGLILISGQASEGLDQATPTPFQPLENTPAPTGTPSVPAVQVEVTVPAGLVTAADLLAGTPEATLAPTPTAVIDPYRWYGMELTDTGGLVRLVIAPPEEVNWGNSVEVAFRVGYPCEYANHRACLSAHEQGRLLLATVHSGVGGEGQSLRHALEGTGFNRAGYGLDRIAANVSALRGAEVRAEQEGGAASRLRVVAAGRVPAAAVQEYFSLPFDEALALAGISLDEELARAQAGESALLVIETCGWRQSDEPGAPGISDTTGSVYLVVMGE